MSYLTPFIFAAALALVHVGAVAAADEPPGSTIDDMADVVNVDRASARAAGGSDGVAELLVSGTLPSSCHQPVWEVVSVPDAVQVWLWSWPGDDPACEATLTPFELTISLGAIDVSTPVLLEGEPVSWTTGSPADPVTALTGAGWSFGMCLGTCEVDIELRGDQAVMTGRDRELSEPVFHNQGQLTADGAARIDDALEALQDVALEPVYGCPDCADGGAAVLRLQRESGETVHELEFGDPPAELSELYDITTAIGEALQLCRSNDVIVVADGCVVGS